MEWMQYGSCVNSMLLKEESRKYKVEKFSTHVQQYVLQAVLDPSILSESGLSLVLEEIVQLCLEDCQYSSIGAELCNVIIQKEQETSNSANFVYKHLMKLCQKNYENKCDLRSESVSRWIGFVNFVCHLFQTLQDHTKVECIVFDCLFTLVGPECLQNDDEVDCLVTQLHTIGKSLEAVNEDKMEELFVDIRGAILAWSTPALARPLLLQAIELRAGGWKLQESARDFYYGGMI
ncbi:MIF4G domain-containing protein-like [Glandiceps talaboti]